MPSPYFLTLLLYALVATLMALDAAFTSYGLISPIEGLRWLRVHFVTLGVMTQLIFGVLPGLVARKAGTAGPAVRWDIWAALNVGFPILLVGIPLASQLLVLVGGSLVFLATGLLLGQLSAINAQGSTANPQPAGQGRKFYLAGLAYLCLGIFVGVGFRLGWTVPLQMVTPIEVHIHANNWGFMALVFAGLMIDLHEEFGGQPLAWPNSVRPIFFMMIFGAFGLVMGPWVGSELLLGPGLILHVIATVWLLLNVLRPLAGVAGAWTTGIWHVALSYVWFFAPLSVAPFILMNVSGFPHNVIEQNAPQALIYGWVLQFGYAFGPFLIRHMLRPGEPNSLGGNMWSLVTVNLGCMALWASIFIEGSYDVLHGTAYVLWMMSLLPVVRDLWTTVTARSLPDPVMNDPNAVVIQTL